MPIWSQNFAGCCQRTSRTAVFAFASKWKEAYRLACIHARFVDQKFPRWFPLIELLIVITIIAVLVSIAVRFSMVCKSARVWYRT